MSSADTPARSGRRTWSGVAEFDRLAEAEGVDRSTMIRTLLAEAMQAHRRSR